MLLHLVSIPIPGIPLYVIPGVVRTPRRRGGRPPDAGLPPRSSPGSAFPRLSQIIYQIFSHKGIVMMIVQYTIIKISSCNVIVMIVLTGAVAHLSHNVLPGRSSLRILEEKDYESSALGRKIFL